MATVLVIDDDRAIVRLISLVLESERIDVEKAYNAQEGLGFVQNHGGPPDSILLDLSMPDMDGREFFREARGAGYEGPILFCSSYGATAANQELGGQGAIEKPFDPDVLLDKVRSELAVI
jgi:DNA-binding response OmpR family regulator